MNFNLCFHFITLLYKPLIFVFIYYSIERDIIFNVVNENEESFIAPIIKKMKLEYESRQYKKYTIKFIERICLKFDIYNKTNKINQNIEIYLCHHIKKSDFFIFYEFLILYYLPVYKMTIEKFYTVLYFLEYFRVKYDNKLRNAIKIIWYSLMKSNEMIKFNIEKVSLHLSKQDYFSYDLFKKISQGYFELVNYKLDESELFFKKEDEYSILKEFGGLYTEDRKYINQKGQSMFLMFLNTVDIKYLHINNLEKMNSKSFCFILKNIKKKIDEIVFKKCCISDELICSLNANINLENLEKIVFLKSKIYTSLIFSDFLIKINEFLFYEYSHSESLYKVSEIKEGNFNMVENLIKNEKHPYQKSNLQESIRENNKMSRTNKKFYFKLFSKDKFKNKVKICESLCAASYNLKFKCFYEYNGCLINVSIDLESLHLKQFTIRDTIIENNIKKIVISISKMTSGFLKDLLNINGLESLELYNADILEINETYINDSIKYFSFQLKPGNNLKIFFKLIDMMIGLQEISFISFNNLTLNHMLDSKDSSYSLKFLLKNSDLSSIENLSLNDFSVDESYSEVLSNFSI
ncbi:hypothetical protein CWI39_1799p0010 [Hamiltosporidium magnivora]|uniref:Uncharacterized protein n=1 Tax=Hamiltosporidium magnivora TaxID=148818 RepID=A0A4Q9KZB9_9MICR|nr:hypothetical protein CWI39_1799p0010 [Hamiltosporidium magnivora]